MSDNGTTKRWVRFKRSERRLDPGRLEAELVENAAAFLARAVRGATEDSTNHQELTFAVLDLAVGIEVLLKARLVREHWTLVSAPGKTPSQARMAKGSLPTVNPKEAIARLKDAVGVSFDDSGSDRSAEVEKVADLRNRAAHFTLAGESIDPIRAQIGAGLLFAHWFLKAEFDEGDVSPEVWEHVEKFFADTDAQLLGIQEFIDVRMAELESQLAAAELCVKCPNCEQIAFVFTVGDDPRCLFCDACPGPDPVELAHNYVEDVIGLSQYLVGKQGLEWPVQDCFVCDEGSLVEGIKQERPRWEELNPAPGLPCDVELPYSVACFACGLKLTRAEYTNCGRCNRIAQQDLCPECDQEAFARF